MSSSSLPTLTRSEMQGLLGITSKAVGDFILVALQPYEIEDGPQKGTVFEVGLTILDSRNISPRTQPRLSSTFVDELMPKTLAVHIRATEHLSQVNVRREGRLPHNPNAFHIGRQIRIPLTHLLSQVMQFFELYYKIGRKCILVCSDASYLLQYLDSALLLPALYFDSL